MAAQEEVDDQALKAVVEILEREIRIVSADDGGEEYWRVKPGNLEHCAKLIVQRLYS